MPTGARGAAGHGGTAGVTAASSYSTHAAMVKAVNSLENECKLLVASVTVVADGNATPVAHGRGGWFGGSRPYFQVGNMAGPQAEPWSWGILLALVQSVCRPGLDAVAGVWDYGGHHHRNSHTITLVVSDKSFAWTGIYVTHEFH